MNDANADLTATLAALLRAAEATKVEETAVRRAAAHRIAELEKARVRAYRRHHFIQLLGSGVAAADPAHQTAVAAQTAALASRLEWGEAMTSEQSEVIAALEPLMTRVAEAHAGEAHAGEGHGGPASPQVTPTVGTVAFEQATEPADLVATLETFEQWFATRFESDFFHVFERYQPESRATDF